MSKEEGERVTLREVYNLVDDKIGKVDDKVNELAGKVSNIEGRLVMVPMLISSAIGIFTLIVNLVIKK
jgi:predicted aconitase with swiveling domain